MKKKPAAALRLPLLAAAGKKKPEEHQEHSLPVQLKPKTAALKEDLLAEGLNNAIHEYLLKNNFAATLDCFQKELARGAQPRPLAFDYQAKLLDVPGRSPAVRPRQER